MAIFAGGGWGWDDGFRPVSRDDIPVFCCDAEKYTLFYAPGALCVVARKEAHRFALAVTAKDQRPCEEERDWSQILRQQPAKVADHHRELQSEPFCPECLTLYLNRACNLQCTYCYALPEEGSPQRLSLQAIRAGTALVAANCQRKGLPLTLVLHGGGEPMLNPARIESALDAVRRLAEQRGVDVFVYVATNGLLSPARAKWLAQYADLVGLSCDGPPDIHDVQRPTPEGRGSLAPLLQTAAVLRAEGCPIHVRTTITPAGMERQSEIAAYICEQIKPQEIHVEPVYCGGRTQSLPFTEAQVDAFVAHFRRAQATAQRLGVLWCNAGSRLGQVHGPYCNVFRQVLTLVPGDVATACFKSSDGQQAAGTGGIIGRLSADRLAISLDQEKISSLRVRLSRRPAYCLRCFNRFHCAGECPDVCAAFNLDGMEEPGFRCLVQKQLAAATLRDIGARLWAEAQTQKIDGPHGTTDL